jgi:phosphatidylinositol alpha-1,6-mannosyltransferase
VIVGEGPARSRLERLAVRHDRAHGVVFAGAVPDQELPEYFAAADVFAMPCRTRAWGLDVEGLGTVFLQAAAVGKPAIAGRSGGTSDAVLEGTTGLLVDGRSTTAIANALLRLLRFPDEARALGARGAERVRRDLTWPVLASRLERWLHETAATRRR